MIVLTRFRPSRQSQHGDDDDGESTDSGNRESDNVEDTKGPNSLKPPTKFDTIEIYCSNNTVSWADKNGDLQNTDSLDLEIVIDNTSNSAFIKLYGDIYINNRTSFSRRSIYMYIRPETIVSIAYRNDNNMRSLHFSLQRKPDLITPKEPIKARPRSQALLDAIIAISTVTDFTVRLDSSSTAPSHLLKKLASIFSPRPTWNDELGDLSRLYGGEGGQIVNASKAVSTVSTVEASTESDDNARTESEAQSPPPYRSASKKRKRDIPDVESGPSSAKSDMPPINVMLREMEKRIMKSIQQLGEKLDDADPCRYSTEERDDVLAAVTQRCDDEFIDIKVESTDVLEEVKEEVERVLNQVDDDVEERIEMIQDEIDERIKSIAQSTAEEAAEKYVKERLLNATWRMDGTMSLH
ncbi:hypothetical protein V8C26DRAFT_389759 [Trichoderma gracile]